MGGDTNTQRIGFELESEVHMKRRKQIVTRCIIAVILITLVGAVGFAQSRRGEGGAGFGKTPDEVTMPEAEQKADGRAAQGAKEPGPPEIDTLTHASGNYYYEAASLSGEELWSAIAEFRAATIVSTINRDHSPNASFVIPGYVEEEVLSFGLADNQTAENLLDRDWAVITVLVHDPEIESPYEAVKYRGARIVVERISDEAEINRLMESYGGRPGTIFVRVVEVLPMG